jgi:phage terminase large subunit-like protein
VTGRAFSSPPRDAPRHFVKRLVAMDDIRITTGSTYDNAEHLSSGFLKKVRELYEGTRLGRQELQGAMILDPMNALFKDDWLIHSDVPEDMIEQVTVGVDPSGGDDEVGIVASALLHDGRRRMLGDADDLTGIGGKGDVAAPIVSDDLRPDCGAG